MTIKGTGSSPLDRAQALGVATRYATPRTSEAVITQLPGGRFKLSVTVPLAGVKPANLNERVRAAQVNGLVTGLALTASKKSLETSGPVEVSVAGNELRVEATFDGDPSVLAGLLKELGGLDLSFKQPRGGLEFRVDMQLAELKLDRTPTTRALAEKGVAEAKIDLETWRSDFEAAKVKLPGETAALERERTEAARAVDDAQAAVTRARAAIDARAESVPTADLATVLRSVEAPAGKQWLEARLELTGAKAALKKAEALVQERADVERAGVTAEEAGLGAMPDLAAAGARVAQAEAAMARADAEVREAFKKDPDARAHLSLADMTGDASDRARAEALSESIGDLWTATTAAHDVAQRRVADPSVSYPQLIAAAEAEVARLETALATLEPTVKTIELGKRGDDTAQRALFGLRDGQSWEAWRKATLEERRDSCAPSLGEGGFEHG